MRSNTRLRAGILFFAAAPLLAQAPKEITVAWCYSDEGEAVGKTPKTYWTSDDDVLLLDETRPAASRGLERVRPTGDRESAFDGAKAMTSLKAMLPDAPGKPSVARLVRSGRPPRGLRHCRRPVPARPRLLELREDRPRRGEDLRGASFSGRREDRLRPRPRSLGLRRDVEGGETRHRRRRRDGPERGPLVGLLGGGVQPPGGGLLVVARFQRNRVPPHGRGRHRRGRVPAVRDGGSRRRDPALPEGRQQEPGCAPRHRRLLDRKDGLDGFGGLRVRPRRPMAAGEPRRRGADDRPRSDAAGSLAGGSRQRPRGPRADRDRRRLGQPEGAAVRRQRRFHRHLRAGRPHAPVPLRRGRASSETR